MRTQVGEQNEIILWPHEIVDVISLADPKSATRPPPLEILRVFELFVLATRI